MSNPLGFDCRSGKVFLEDITNCNLLGLIYAIFPEVIGSTSQLPSWQMIPFNFLVSLFFLTFVVVKPTQCDESMLLYISNLLIYPGKRSRVWVAMM